VSVDGQSEQTSVVDTFTSYRATVHLVTPSPSEVMSLSQFEQYVRSVGGDSTI